MLMDVGTVKQNFVTKTNPQSIDIAIGILFLTPLKLFMEELPAWRPPPCIQGVSQCHGVLLGSIAVRSIGMADLRNIGTATGIAFLLVFKCEIRLLAVWRPPSSA